MSYTHAVWMAIGIAAGAGIGAAAGSMAIGIAAGAGLGLAAGIAIEAWRKR